MKFENTCIWKIRRMLDISSSLFVQYFKILTIIRTLDMTKNEWVRKLAPLHPFVSHLHIYSPKLLWHPIGVLSVTCDVPQDLATKTVIQSRLKLEINWELFCAESDQWDCLLEFGFYVRFT